MTGAAGEWDRTACGARLRTARTAAGLAQHELADQLGLSRSAIANIEGGRAGTTVAVLVRAAHILRADPAWLILGDPTTTPAELVAVRTYHAADTAARTLAGFATSLTDAATLLADLAAAAKDATHP